MIRYTCPYCGNHLEIPDQFAGRAGYCQQCKNKIRVPQTFDENADAWEAVRERGEVARPEAEPEWVTIRQTEKPRFSSNLAFASLMLGVFSFIAPLILSIPGIVTGHMALVRIKRSAGMVGGKGMAAAGLACSYVTFAGAIAVACFLALVMSETSSVAVSGPRAAHPANEAATLLPTGADNPSSRAVARPGRPVSHPAGLPAGPASPPSNINASAGPALMAEQLVGSAWSVMGGTVSLEAGGVAKVSHPMFPTPIQGTWSVAGDRITLSAMGQSIVAQIVGSQILHEGKPIPRLR